MREIACYVLGNRTKYFYVYGKGIVGRQETLDV